MIKSFLSPIKKHLSLLAFVGFAVGSVQPVFAQFGSSTPQPLEDLQNPNRGDIFSNRGGNQTGSMLDIIHRAIQGQGRSLEEYTEEQRENLDSAAEEFLKLRQQRLGNQTPTPPTTPTPATPPSN